jgi:hypothetical protein
MRFGELQYRFGGEGMSACRLPYIGLVLKRNPSRRRHARLTDKLCRH